ncbi:MAG: hypothetical protein JNM36_05220 [Chitinophagales bacterium]|nr:hypothetical protein [Chitinophagales bacterium]
MRNIGCDYFRYVNERLGDEFLANFAMLSNENRCPDSGDIAESGQRLLFMGVLKLLL